MTDTLSRSRNCLSCVVAILVLLTVNVASLQAQQAAPACPSCAIWNAPQEPFKVYGNTYYVGTHGLSSILITSKSGNVLIDGGLPESASQIVAHIRALGFRIEDVKLIVNSHVHFDHAGGISELQRMSGARVVASDWSAAVMAKGGVARDDPQYGVITQITQVANVSRLRGDETLRVGDIALTAHLTSGHTPGGTSWTWKACEQGRCLEIVYADSVTPVSAPNFKFTAREHSQALKDFEKSFSFFETVPCDILVTPHPDASELWTRLERRGQNALPDPMIDSSACRNLAAAGREQLRKRIAEEQAR